MPIILGQSGNGWRSTNKMTFRDYHPNTQRRGSEGNEHSEGREEKEELMFGGAKNFSHARKESRTSGGLLLPSKENAPNHDLLVRHWLNASASASASAPRTQKLDPRQRSDATPIQSGKFGRGNPAFGPRRRPREERWKPVDRRNGISLFDNDARVNL